MAYHAYFIGYGYMFEDYPLIKDNIYTFNLEVVSGNPHKSVYDERIGLTISEIFHSFFTIQNNVAIYICDSADKRHLARKRKFDLWFWKYNDNCMIKEDGLAVIEDTEIYDTLLVHKKNEYLELILHAFRDLNARADDK